MSPSAGGRERTALVTLAIGELHRELWQRCCRENWQRYADRHGYDVICLESPLDDSERARSRSPAWQKCLVLEQPELRRYDRVVWIDADILIAPHAPAITDGVPRERVGAVDEYASPTRERHDAELAKLYHYWEASGTPFVPNLTAAEYYEVYGLPGRFDSVVQTGVMVLSPAHHQAVLRRTYDAYEDRGPRLNYEMRPLSYELLDADLVFWLDPRFNRLWGVVKATEFPFLLNHPAHERAGSAARAALEDSYCLHFTGSLDDMALVADAPPVPHRRRAASAPPTLPRCTVPVALFVYARPDTTARVLERIRAVAPPRLLVVGDAARTAADAEAVARTRALLEQVDWDCEVRTQFAGTHLGLRGRLESGLDWVFTEVEQAIILEDDCLPDGSFFRYCEELLDRYRDEERVMSISGDNFRSELSPDPSRYGFSRYSLVWGWATWRRAWALHDPAMHRWPELRDGGWLLDLLGDPVAARYWAYQLESAWKGNQSWDYAWGFSQWLHGGLCAVPEVNLVTNIGFRADATHTRAEASAFANLPAQPACFPLTHPGAVRPNTAADAFLEDVMFSGNLTRMLQRLRVAHGARQAARP